LKTLVLIRHAKSSWKDDNTSDFDRPLNHRGKTDAPMMGKVLRQRQVIPDRYLVSPANRAVTTAQYLTAAMGVREDVVVTDHSLYLAEPQSILDVIATKGGSAKTLFVTGHNPGFTELANSISQARIDNVPTCGIFAVAFDISAWNAIAGQQGRFLFFDYPKNHK
jgi:phosphohistidine phosphatase